MMSNENQIITISGFTGMAIGIMLMMIVSREQTINYCCIGEIEEIEYSVCEDCWLEVFSDEEMYQY